MKVVLVIAYLSMFGEPDIAVHTRTDFSACQKEALTIFKKVRAGSARVWCERVIDGERNEHR